MRELDYWHAGGADGDDGADLLDLVQGPGAQVHLLGLLPAATVAIVLPVGLGRQVDVWEVCKETKTM